MSTPQQVFPAMRVLWREDIQKFLAYLNGTRNFGRDLKFSVKAQYQLALEKPENPANQGWCDVAAVVFKPAPGADYIEAGEQFTVNLKRYVDQWIGSGFNPDGSEEPFKRDLNRMALGDRQDLGVFLNRWLDANHARSILFSTGEIRQSYTWRSSFTVEDKKTPAAEADDELARQLIFFLQSPLRGNLTQCAKPSCRIYYVRNKLRQYYKRSTFCATCRSSASARRRMEEKRGGARDRALATAAFALNAWKEIDEGTRMEYGLDERAYIAAAMADLGRKRTWVSRNMTEIERIAERTSNAKG